MEGYNSEHLVRSIARRGKLKKMEMKKMTTRNENMTETQQRMFDVVDDHNGRVDRETYLAEIADSITANGGTPNPTSLKAHCFTAKNLAGAGLQKIDINGQQYVWSDEQVEAAINGTTRPRGGLASTITTTATGSIGVSAPSPNVFCGIAKRDASAYPADIQALIPTEAKGYVEQGLVGSELEFMAFCHKMNSHLMTQGGTGCGKTMAIYEFARLIGQPICRIVGGVGIEWDDLQGTLLVRETASGATETRFIDGQLTKAMRHGCILYIDEINFIKPAVLSQLNDVLDAGHMVINQNETASGAEVLHAHPDFRIVASMNPNYAGTSPLNNATRRRFSRTLNFDYLGRDLEIDVIQQQSGNFNVDAATEIVQFARNVRKANESMTFSEPTDLGTSTLVTVMETLSNYNMQQTLDTVVYPLFDVDDIEEVKILARANIEDLA